MINAVERRELFPAEFFRFEVEYDPDVTVPMSIDDHRFRLTNHGISASVAISTFLEPSALRAWQNHYLCKVRPELRLERFESLDPPPPYGQGTSNPEHFSAVVDYYASSRTSVGEIVGRTLLRSLEAGALHGLIHLGYALRSQDRRAILQGLAYMHVLRADTFDDAAVDADAPTLSLAEVDLEPVRVAVASSGSSPQFDVSMRAGLRGLKNVRVDASVDELFSFARTAFASTVVSQGRRDFFLLHGVTGCVAAAQVLEILSPTHRRVARERLAKILLVASVTRRASYDVQIDVDGPPLSKESVRRWMRSKLYDADEHVFKLIEACFTTRSDPTSRFIAADLMKHPTLDFNIQSKL